MRKEWIVSVSLCCLLLAGMVFAEETKTENFTGTVTGLEGKPVEGAAVSLYLLTIDRASMSYQVRLVSQTKSDAEGKISFLVDKQETGGYAVYCCLAQKEGLSCGWVMLAGTNQTTLDIQLTQPQKMIGFVQNSDGTPVPEAEVRLAILSISGRQERSMLGLEPIDAFVTKTCSDGRFVFTNLPEGTTAEFLVKKPGKGTLTTFNAGMNPKNGLTYKAGQTDIMLTMQDGCKISGIIVVKEDQKPAAGISVMAMDSKFPINIIRRPIQSAEDGRFEFTDLAPGDYKVGILDDNWLAEPLTLTVSADADTIATIELIKGGLLEVKVIDGETKEAIAKATVNLRDEQTQQYQQLLTDENGVGHKQVLAGTYKASVYKQGYRSANETQTVTVENGKTATVTIELSGQSKIDGLVLDPDGKPVEGAVIQLMPNWGGPRSEDVKSDEKGKFKMAWDPAQMGGPEEMDFYLMATLQGKNLAGIVQIGRDAKEATIKLQKGIRIKGKVLNQDGKPIAGARTMVYFRGSRFSSPFGPETKTDGNGEYTFNTLAADQRYSVNITNAEGYGTGQQEVEIVSDASETTVKEIILRLADQKLSGQVVDVDGKPLADVQLHCYGNGQPNCSAKTDKDGKFLLEKVCSGEINISANYQKANEYQYGHVRTEGGAEDVKIIVTNQGGNERFVPKTAPSLIGKPLPDLAGYGAAVPADANSVLVFAWDMSQRPSRHFIKQLADKAAMLKEKGVAVILLNAAPADKNALDAWLKENGLSYPCGIIAENAEKVKFEMGIQGLPWLILTDAERKVIAEGFSVEALEGKLDSR